MKGSIESVTARKTEKRSARSAADLVCFSHLSWKGVWQRPQHLMSRFATERRVFFIQEPEKAKDSPYLQVEKAPEKDRLYLVTPYVVGTDIEAHAKQQSMLLKRLFAEQDIHQPILWYYTPMALRFSRHLPAGLIVYDMMDDLSAFKNSPQGFAALEDELFQAAGLVFTGGGRM